MIRVAEIIHRLTGWKRGMAAIAAGIISALSMPPYDLWPFLFVGVPLSLLLMEGLPQRAPWKAFWTGWLFGFGYFLLALHWIAYAFFVDVARYLWMMPFALGGLCAFLALYWGAAAVSVNLLKLRGLRLVIGFAAALAGFEWLRGHLFTGFPWAAPGLSVDGMGAVAQAASLIGMTGLTLVIVLVAGLPLMLMQKAWTRRDMVVAMMALLVLPGFWLFGTLRLSEDDPLRDPPVKVRIVQPSISQEDKWRADNARLIFDDLKALSAEPLASGAASDANVIIWPESAVPFLIDESEGAQTELSYVLGGKAVLLTGALRRDIEKKRPEGDVAVYNSIIAFDGDATVAARYDKWRLVPGGEFLPLGWLLEPLGFRRVVSVPGSFHAGEGPVTVALPGLPAAAMLICYEVIFPDRLINPADRPDWIVNVTNDGWFGMSTGPYQHLAQARLRTIEQGLPLARAANTGISAMIDAKGRIMAHLPLGQKAIVDAELPAAIPAPLYARLGDYMLLGLLLGAATLLWILGLARDS